MRTDSQSLSTALHQFVIQVLARSVDSNVLLWRGFHASQPTHCVGLLALSLYLPTWTLAVSHRFIGRMPSGKRKAEEFAAAGLFPEAAEVVVPPKSLPTPPQRPNPRTSSRSALLALALRCGMELTAELKGARAIAKLCSGISHSSAVRCPRWPDAHTPGKYLCGRQVDDSNPYCRLRVGLHPEVVFAWIQDGCRK